MVPGAIFREYDIRGVFGQDLTPDVAARVARAFAAYLRREVGEGPLPVVVGHDNRLSSPALHRAVVDALVESGCEVTDVGLVTTPVFYFARVHLGIDGGVMVTASHNPPEYNGFKLAHGFGTLYGEQIQEVRRLAEAGVRVGGPGKVQQVDVVPAYRSAVRERVKLGPRRLRVVVDCGNGTASVVAPAVLRDLGVDVVELYCESDATFPHHHPDPVDPKNLQDLVRAVVAEGADVGVGFDGDGDRIGVVDDRGRIVWGDELMILFWREILPRYPGAQAIVEVKCSQALVDEIRRLGGRPFFYRTGHSLIKAKMKEIGAVFTGEMSGHMFFADEWYGFDDAVYAAARLLRILSHADRPLSQLLADVPRYHATPEVRVPCPDDRKFAVVEQLVRQFKERYEVVDVDGARVLFSDGWGLVRASNTQPVLVVRAEGTTREALTRIQRTLEEALAQFPEVGRVDWGVEAEVGR
ncbi:MAG: phosphomannomutase/phosphoglucomutase [Armatimonadota bacterium]|nr:phosphomannomutase/phosphoglucomutase [Armatimonadota bacterium]MDW8155872.1 phosphomannomutase/phosphoglucomutase [Armatimonadota bacterium]